VPSPRMMNFCIFQVETEIILAKIVNCLRGIHLNKSIVPIGMSQNIKSAGFIRDTGSDYYVCKLEGIVPSDNPDML